MKKLISVLLAVCLLASLGAAYAIDAGVERTVIGADLTDDQIASVYEAFGIDRSSVKELQVTNADERKYLDGYVDESVIGTRAISCVYIKTQDEGTGLDVTTSNITWCTPEMYVSALATAGISDAQVVVAAPFEVSGTAALTGVYMSYEDITGQQLDETAKLAGTQELTVTADLAEQIGSYGSVEIVNELKLILGETKDMTDDALKAEIVEIAGAYNVTLTDGQIGRLVDLCRSLEKLDSDALKAKVESVQDTLKKMAEAKTKVAGFTQAVQQVITAVAGFFQRLFTALSGGN